MTRPFSHITNGEWFNSMCSGTVQNLWPLISIKRVCLFELKLLNSQQLWSCRDVAISLLDFYPKLEYQNKGPAKPIMRIKLCMDGLT